MSPGFLSLRMTSLLHGWHFANIFYKTTIKALLMLPETKTVYRSLCISSRVIFNGKQHSSDGWMDILQGMVLIIKDSHVAPFTSSKECLEWISTVV